MTFRRSRFSAVAILIVLVFCVVADAARAAGGGKPPKLVVLGFDGADAKLTEKWMDEGKLPNLAKLRQLGGYRRLAPTMPAQTPVSWSSFSTGLDPGGTAIFDFLKRDPKTYLPSFAVADEIEQKVYFGEKNPTVFGAAAGGAVFVLVTVIGGLATGGFGAPAIAGALLGLGSGVGVGHFVGKNIPARRPGATNNRRGETFWETLGAAGVRARIVQVPVTFPPKEFAHGHLLSGLGVPDVRGRIGTPAFYTSEVSFSADRSNEFSVEVVELPDNRGTIETEVFGPPDKLFAPKDAEKPPTVKEKMTLTVPETRDSLRIQVPGADLTLKPGEWSDWVAFTFRFNSVVKLQAVGRFHLYSVKPEVKLYLSPLNFHPGALPSGLAITHPEGWSEELHEKFGIFKTMGWAIDTWSIAADLMDEKTFLEDVDATVSKFREMFRAFLASGEEDVLVQCFEFTDRVGHIFWRLTDPDHPAYDAAKAEKYGDAILRSYQRMDEIVGDVLPYVEKGETTLLVCSDHGFSTWKRSINTNTWLARNGFLALKGVESGEKNLEELFGHGTEFWVNVDWSKTRAYALGLGGLYVNLAGREDKGIVKPGEEYRLLVKELQEKLTAWTDPATGLHPVRRVYTRDEAYRAYDPQMMPDMFVANDEGYRVSWQTSLGGTPKDDIEINKQAWSGDHCSLDPAVVPGIFFSSRRIPAGSPADPTITDLAPTILRLLGVPPKGRLDGRNLL